MLVLTLLTAGRAMTLAFIPKIGSHGAGAPPEAWLMPLIGDAAIGLSALGVAYVISRRAGLWAWTLVVVWSALAIWDALAAFLVNVSNPWPEFFMLQTFGSSMFFAAAIMHAVILYLACTQEVRCKLLGAAGCNATAQMAECG